jgi:two-component system, LuxR family, response regulator FixJ
MLRKADANAETNSSTSPQAGIIAAETPSDEVFVVDDDPMVGELLQMTLSSDGFRATTFSDGESFIAVARRRVPACIILDVYMPGRSGLDILKDLDAHNYAAPIIVMSGKATIAIAVDAVKSGAFDIIEKPFSPDAIVARVRAVTRAWTRHRAHGRNLAKDFSGSECLTSREADVLAEILGAASNKEAGHHLGISPRTVEVHRARIMAKLGARNTADLVRIALAKPDSRRIASTAEVEATMSPR